MSNRLFSTLLLISLLGAPVLSQQPSPTTATTPQQQDETVRVGTAVVQFEAIVTDKTGRRVTGLTAEDFQVLDEGKPQPLDFFTAVEDSRVRAADARASAAGATAGGAGVPLTPLVTPYEGRYIAIIFDDLSLSAENFIRSRRALRDYINTKVSSNDMVAIISTGGALGSLQQFTNDKQRLLSAVDRISAQTSIAEKLNDPRFRITPTEAVRIDSGDRFTLDNVVQRVAGEDTINQAMTRESIEAQVQNKSREIVTQMNLVLRSTLRTVENLSRAMGDLPGRKIVALVTESLTTAGGSTGDVTNQITQLMELARRSGVSVYALDAGGVRATNVTASERITATGLQARGTNPNATFSDFENLSAARALVVGTGGEMITNTNNLSEGLERAVEDSSTYYVLGFKPATLDNKFHRLSVTLKGKPDLIVRTRRGYLAVNQETARGTNTELAAALISPVARTELPLEVVANVVPKGGAQVVVTGLHVGRRYLTLPAEAAPDKQAVYEVVAWVFAAGRDQPVGVIKTDVTYDLTNPQAAQKLKSDGFLLAHTFTDLTPGTYQIRAVVREKATGLVGSSYQFFEVPDLKSGKTVALSSIVLTPAGQTEFGGHNAFKAGGMVDARYIIYNPPKDMSALTQSVRLVDGRGTVLMDSPLPVAGVTPSAGTLMAVQATRLNLPRARGRYALLVHLKDAKGKVDVERRADFVVE